MMIRPMRWLIVAIMVLVGVGTGCKGGRIQEALFGKRQLQQTDESSKAAQEGEQEGDQSGGQADQNNKEKTVLRKHLVRIMEHFSDPKNTISEAEIRALFSPSNLSDEKVAPLATDVNGLIAKMAPLTLVDTVKETQDTLIVSVRTGKKLVNLLLVEDNDALGMLKTFRFTASKDSPLYRYLEWVMKTYSNPQNRITEADLRPIFSSTVVPDASLGGLVNVLNNTIATFAPMTQERIVASSPDALVVQVQPASSLKTPDPSPLNHVLCLDSANPDLLAMLLFQPTLPQVMPKYQSWDEYISFLQSIPGTVALTVGEVDAVNGKCNAVAELQSDKSLPIGSAYKLYLLYALAQQIEAGGDAGKLNWGSSIPITAALKSLPSGTTQLLPDGTELAVEELAQKMIAISDNTAANVIADRLGRVAVESVLAELGNRDGRNRPFLTSQEFFKAKFWPPKQQRKYSQASIETRRQMLEGAKGEELPPLDEVHQWVIGNEPRAINSLEWFATTNDLCRLMAAFEKRGTKGAFKKATELLQSNDGGLFQDRGFWDEVWFKGGSEPGVFNMTYLLKKKGRSWVFAITFVDEGGAVAGGAFSMVAAGLAHLQEVVSSAQP